VSESEFRLARECDAEQLRILERLGSLISEAGARILHAS